LLIASMKKLMMQHTEAMDRYTNLDLKSIQEKVTFLFEFDREVQYVGDGRVYHQRLITN